MGTQQQVIIPHSVGSRGYWGLLGCSMDTGGLKQCVDKLLMSDLRSMYSLTQPTTHTPNNTVAMGLHTQ